MLGIARQRPFEGVPGQRRMVGATSEASNMVPHRHIGRLYVQRLDDTEREREHENENEH